MLFDTVKCENEDVIDELINDSDTELIAREEVKFTENLDNATVLTPEANFHVADEGTTHIKELETYKKTKNWKKIPQWHRNATFLHILKRIVFLMEQFPKNLTKVLQLLIYMTKLLILMFWLNCLFNKATSICNKAGGIFS